MLWIGVRIESLEMAMLGYNLNRWEISLIKDILAYLLIR